MNPSKPDLTGQGAHDMKKTIDYLDDAKKVLGLTADRDMAKHLKVTPQAVSNYRGGVSVMDDYAAAKIAEILGINEMIVIAAANAEREKTEDRKEFWKNFYERLGGVAAAILLSVTLGNVTLIMTPGTANACPTSQVVDLHCILCKIKSHAAV